MVDRRPADESLTVCPPMQLTGLHSTRVHYDRLGSSWYKGGTGFPLDEYVNDLDSE